MRRTLSVLALAASVAVGAPAEAQDLITVGHFTTVAVADVPAFEEAAREHAQWHGSQNDPTPWPTYQAMTGHGEYAFLMSNVPWSALDNPAISPADDVEHWSSSGGEYTQTLETTIWTSIPGGNPPADPTAFPVVQVFEFEVAYGGMQAVMEGVTKYSEAVRQVSPDVHFGWSRVVSADGPESVFIAVWHPNFESLDGPPTPPQEVMAQVHGAAETMRISGGFSAVATLRSNQIWVYRPDLSHMPGM